MFSELRNGLGFVVIVFIVGVCAFIVSKVQPQVEQLVTLPSRIEVANADAKVKVAQSDALASAQSEFVKIELARKQLENDALRGRIDDSHLLAQAEANAKLLKAQSDTRMAQEIWEFTRALIVATILVGLVFFGMMRFRDREWKARPYMVTKPRQSYLPVAEISGYLPEGTRDFVLIGEASEELEKQTLSSDQIAVPR